MHRCRQCCTELDCAGDQSCYGGVCRAGNFGEWCPSILSGSRCSAGRCCLEGDLVHRCRQCCNDLDCPGNQGCYGGVCRAGQINEPCSSDGRCASGHCFFTCRNCVVESHCPSSQGCYDYVCRAGNLGEVCLTDSRCASGHCSITCVACELNNDRKSPYSSLMTMVFCGLWLLHW